MADRYGPLAGTLREIEDRALEEVWIAPSRLVTVIGIGAFWWLRTGRHSSRSAWLVSADLIVLALTLCWSTVVVTPIERSQPDMRTGRSS